MTTTPHGPDEDERRLQELFDATVEPPTEQQLHRMARAAAQIPERAPRGLLARLLRTVRRPAVLAAAAAACALLAAAYFGGRGGPRPEPSSPVALTSAPTEQPAPHEAPTVDQVDDEIERILAAIDFEEDEEDIEDDDLIVDDPLAALELGASAEHPMAPLELLFAPDDEGSADLLHEAFSDVLEGG